MDPKESCTRLQAKTFRVEKNFCMLKFFVYQSTAFIRFQLRDILRWDRREPLENCTSLLDMYKNGITYSQCQRRIYFACVQGKAVVPKEVHIIPGIYKVRHVESNFERQICTHATESQLACEQAHLWVTRASGEEQSDPAGRSLVKRCQESEPDLISVFFFISASSERSEIPLVEKRERRENCQSIMLDEERLNPHGVGNLPHNKKTSRPHLESEEELSARTTDVLTKFQSIFG